LKLEEVVQKPTEAMSGKEHWAVYFRYVTDKVKRGKMNFPALKGGVSCLRCKLDEVRSVRKLFYCGVYYHEF
jgi:hypothetical protein